MPEKYLFITVSNDKYIHHHYNFKDKVYKTFHFYGNKRLSSELT